MAIQCTEARGETLCWSVVRESPLEFSSDGFRDGLEVWLRRPHVINRRLCAVNLLTDFTVTASSFDDVIRTLRDSRASFPLLATDVEHTKEGLFKILQRFGSDDHGRERKGFSDCDARTSVSIEIRELLPKRGGHRNKAVEIVLKDVASCVIAFLPWFHRLEEDDPSDSVSPRHCYAFRYSEAESKLQLCIWREELVENGVLSCDVLWLCEKVFPKVTQWIKETAADCNHRKKVIPSLSLISTVDYVATYHDLKAKYGSQLVKIWPERTDPSKFVYEDIAIASYLMVLWNEERNAKSFDSKQSFVDLGCGNGLLTHILCSEGYPGFGIDLKKRNIWDLYGPQTKLMVGSITPSSESLFPDQDWIIGNHSDELTPWIPVISARSSWNSRFFLLPCCAHNFDSKFQRRNSGVSQYEDYLEFVREVAQVCGFDVGVDKLRIPSTKRTCLIGRSRTHDRNEWPTTDERITTFIRSQSCGILTIRSDDAASETWASKFRVRESVQSVRNCTTIDKTIKEQIVTTVFQAVLNGSGDLVDVDTDNGRQRWRTGGVIELSDLVAKLETSMLQRLKNECGGLQTLLRNHYYIFTVIRGKVRLRNYAEGPPRPRRRNLRPQTPLKIGTKLCFFHCNHPDGCPVTSAACLFAHDIRSVDDATQKVT